MASAEQRYTFDRVVRLTLSTIGIIAVILLLRYLSDVLIPFAVAVILAYMLNPLVAVFEQKTRRRGLAVALTLGSLTVASLALLVLLIPLIASQARRFGDSLIKLRSDIASSTAGTETRPPVLETPGAGEPVEPQPEEASIDTELTKSAWGWDELQTAWARYRADANTVPRAERLRQLRRDVAGTYLGDLLSNLIQYTHSDEFGELLVETAKRLAIGGWTIVTWSVHLILAVTGVIIVFVYLVFLLLDYPEYERTWKSFLPPHYRKPLVEFLEQFNLALRRYFRGQSVVAFLTGAVLSLGFTLIGLPMAVPFGLFVGLLNMVPYLQAVALVPAALLAALRAIEGDTSFAMSLALTFGVFGLTQVIQDFLITPRIMGKATGLRPVSILLGLFVWGKLLGFLGVLLAIPLTCLGIAYYRRYVLHIKSAFIEPPPTPAYNVA